MEITKLYKIDKIADFGAGPGHICEAFFRKDYQVWHVDIKGEVFSFAQNRYKDLDLDIRMIEPEQFFEMHEKMDLITCFGVFEHLESPFIFMDKIYKQLRNGGTFAVFADFHNFFQPGHYKEHFIFEPFFLQLMENIGFEHMASQTLPLPKVRDHDRLSMGSLRIDFFRRPMDAVDDNLVRFKKMADKYQLP
jgi:SAM-dependent methyltransferase